MKNVRAASRASAFAIMECSSREGRYMVVSPEKCVEFTHGCQHGAYDSGAISYFGDKINNHTILIGENNSIFETTSDEKNFCEPVFDRVSVLSKN